MWIPGGGGCMPGSYFDGHDCLDTPAGTTVVMFCLKTTIKGENNSNNSQGIASPLLMGKTLFHEYKQKPNLKEY